MDATAIHCVRRIRAFQPRLAKAELNRCSIINEQKIFLRAMRLWAKNRLPHWQFACGEVPGRRKLHAYSTRADFCRQKQNLRILSLISLNDRDDTRIRQYGIQHPAKGSP